MTAFKTEEKRYKAYKGYQNDFSRVLDLPTLSSEQLFQKGITKQENDGKVVYIFENGVIVVKGFLALD
jgi:hypothetical protein